MSDPGALYQAVIVAHDRAPRNEGPLPGATHEATIDNPLCGDVVTMRVIVDGGAVREARFEGRGCALMRAAASIATTQLAGRRVDELPALIARFEAFVREPAGAPVPAELGELSAFAGVRAFRSRQACATLPFRALTAALTSP